MKKTFIICLLGILCFTSVHAQINPRPGYIITNENDTINGYLDFRTGTKNSRKCDFCAETETQYNSYYPNDIKGFRFIEDGKMYISKKIKVNNESADVFLEYLIKGIVNLYSFSNAAEIRYFMESSDGHFIEVYNTAVERADNNMPNGEYNRYKHVGILNRMFEESEEVKKKVRSTKMNRKNLVELTKSYHYAVCNSMDECIEFESKSDKKFRKLSWRINGGMSFWQLHDQILSDNGYGDSSGSSPSGTVLAELTSERFSNYFGLQMGLGLSHFATKDIFKKNMARNSFKAKSLIFDARLGGICWFTKQGVRPYVHAGMAYSNLPTISGGFSYNFSNSGGEQSVEAQDKVKASDILYRNYWGVYGGAGIDFPIRKRAIFVQGTYQFRKREVTRLTTIDVQLGLRF